MNLLTDLEEFVRDHRPHRWAHGRRDGAGVERLPLDGGLRVWRGVRAVGRGGGRRRGSHSLGRAELRLLATSKRAPSGVLTVKTLRYLPPGLTSAGHAARPPRSSPWSGRSYFPLENQNVQPFHRVRLPWLGGSTRAVANRSPSRRWRPQVVLTGP